MGSGDRLHVQPWRHGDDLLDAEQIVVESTAAGVSVVCVGDDVPLADRLRGGRPRSTGATPR